MNRSTMLAGLGIIAVVAAWRAADARASQSGLFAVTFTTGPAWQAEKAPGEQAGFREHSANLARLRKEGRIVAGGRFGAYGLIIVRAAAEPEARELFRDDPTMASGVFRAEFNAWQTIYGGTIP